MDLILTKERWRNYLSEATARMKEYSRVFSSVFTVSDSQFHFSEGSDHILSVFNWQNVQSVTSDSVGVYVMYNCEKTPIFYGKAEKQNLKTKIAFHLDSINPALAEASYFSFEIVNRPSKRLNQLIARHRVSFNSEPECNDGLEKMAIQQLMDEVSRDRSLGYMPF